MPGKGRLLSDSGDIISIFGGTGWVILRSGEKSDH